MKKTILSVFAVALTVGAFAQGQSEAEKTIEKRARDFFRTIQSSEKSEWKKFVVNNYSKALIEKPMKSQVDQGGESTTTTAAGTTMDQKIDGKAAMFGRLHDDFGKGTLSGVKTSANQVEVTIDGGDGEAVVTLKFDTASPYLITGLGVEARR